MHIFAALEDMARSIFTFLWVMTLLVVVHELGHFLFARLFGMKVNAFAVFMGGVRKTDLRPHLAQPLAGRRGPFLLLFLSSVVFALGVALKVAWLGGVGVSLGGIVLALWVGLRLGALYHLDRSRAVQPTLVGTVMALGVLLLTRQIQSFSFLQLATVLSAGAWIGTLWTYYTPTRYRIEEEKMGAGSLEIDGQTVSVNFRPLWHVERNGIEYSILALPVGGFVSIAGMSPTEDGREANTPGGFHSKPAWMRFVVLAAGPAFSIALGAVLVFAGVSIQGEQKATTVVRSFTPDSPAQLAGLREGDLIVSVAGKPVKTFYELTNTIRDRYDLKKGAGIPTEIGFQRGGVPGTVLVTPKVGTKPEPVADAEGRLIGFMIQARMGVYPSVVSVPISPSRAWGYTGLLMSQAFSEMARTFTSAREAQQHVGGVISIAQTAGEVSKAGIGQTLFMGGMLSLSLGVMNLLPIGPLDGGQMLMALIEMVRRGKRLHYRIQAAVMNVGLALVVMLVFSVLALDLARVVSGKKLTDPPPAATKEK